MTLNLRMICEWYGGCLRVPLRAGAVGARRLEQSVNIPRIALWTALVAVALPAGAAPFNFSTGNPDGLMAMASRPSGTGLTEIEAADDFVLDVATSLHGGTFTGLLAGATAADIGDVRIEIYRVFPLDSDTARTQLVPTRANSPSDVALDELDASASDFGFTVSDQGSFTAANSVLNGIHPSPGQTTGGEGAVTGEEINIAFSFSAPLALPAGHYFFVPQVGVTANGGQFYWLSAPKPIVSPGTPFIPDLQTWIRNGDLAPDWLRVGSDIVGSVGGNPAPQFNAAFALTGAPPSTVPEPPTGALLAAALAALALARGRRSLTVRGR